MHPEHVSEHRDVEGERIVPCLPKPHIQRLIGFRANPRLIRWTTISFEGDVEWETRVVEDGGSYEGGEAKKRLGRTRKMPLADCAYRNRSATRCRDVVRDTGTHNWKLAPTAGSDGRVRKSTTIPGSSSTSVRWQGRCFRIRGGFRGSAQLVQTDITPYSPASN